VNVFGAEQTCRVLARTEGEFMTSLKYRAAQTREPSNRAIRDQVLGGEIGVLYAENFRAYGVRKIHRLMQRQGWLIGRDPVPRVMKNR